MTAKFEHPCFFQDGSWGITAYPVIASGSEAISNLLIQILPFLIQAIY
jgi:hypothetical protein